MSATTSLTETQILTALRSVLSGMVSVEIIRSEVNRVPEPLGPNFVLMTPTMRTALSKPTETYPDLLNNPVALITANTEIGVQIDVHGPASAENAQIMTTLLWSGYGTQAFDNLSLDLQVLNTSDPRQTPFINGEAQFEYRWTFDIEMQANIGVTVSQESATSVSVDFIDVDAVYPPT